NRRRNLGRLRDPAPARRTRESAPALLPTSPTGRPASPPRSASTRFLGPDLHCPKTVSYFELASSRPSVPWQFGRQGLRGDRARARCDHRYLARVRSLGLMMSTAVVENDHTKPPAGLAGFAAEA